MNKRILAVVLLVLTVFLGFMWADGSNDITRYVALMIPVSISMGLILDDQEERRNLNQRRGEKSEHT